MTGLEFLVDLVGQQDEKKIYFYPFYIKSYFNTLIAILVCSIFSYPVANNILGVTNPKAVRI